MTIKELRNTYRELLSEFDEGYKRRRKYLKNLMKEHIQHRYEVKNGHGTSKKGKKIGKQIQDGIFRSIMDKESHPLKNSWKFNEKRKVWSCQNCKK